MLHETDLPCSNCGGSLRERDVTSRDLAVAAGTADSAVVAECVDCGARYYPDGTIRRLFEGGKEAAIDGE